MPVVRCACWAFLYGCAAKELAGKPSPGPRTTTRATISSTSPAKCWSQPRPRGTADAEGQDVCYDKAMNDILNGIKDDLNEFRVEHQRWFSEKTLVEGGAVAAAFDALDSAGYTYEKDNAYWFATENLGDDKNRVLRKSDGSLTYFASDIAYHHDKFQRGYDWLIDIWGADHHGYIPRMRAAITAMGKTQDSFDVVLIQLVNLLREGQP